MLFDDRLRQVLAQAARHGRGVAVMFIDLDNFKAVNDQYGHFIGDRVLRDTATLLRGLCRREDVLVRFGADEFVILLGNAGQRAAKTAAERIRGRFQTHRFACGEQEVTLSVSIGVSTLKKEHAASSKDCWELVWTADGAMHLARQKGPGLIQWLDCQGQGQKPAESQHAVL
jgi:diguanylate cyclase (GGDEF)-like protein